MNEVINHLKLQEKFLLDSPKLDDLENFEINKIKKFIKIQVHRNQSFEYIQKIIDKYLNFFDTHVDWIYGEYDDTLSFNNISVMGIDIEIVWLDFSKYSMSQNDFYEWLYKRLENLINLTCNPILISSSLRGDQFKIDSDFIKKFNKKNIYLIRLEKLFDYFGNKFIDEKRAHLFGTRLSRNSQLFTAQNISINNIFPLITPNYKALAVDLDNTLYHGVLGEDGIENLILTEGHIKLQEYLIRLSKKGFFITIVSKNNYEDVKSLFEKRSDFPLKKCFLSGIKANWKNKYQNIKELASELNIHTESFLLIDDNPAELYEAKSYLKNLAILLAKSDASKTLKILDNYPGIYKNEVNETDLLRVRDIQSSSKRKNILENLSMAEYHKELDTTISLFIDCAGDLERLSQISKKTNQFNTSLIRLNNNNVLDYFNNEDKYIISISVRDKISDSGNVGGIFFHIINKSLVINSICLSCRVLGRGLEDIMIFEAISYLIKKNKLNIESVTFQFIKGPRNFPANEWLRRLDQSIELKNEVSEVNIKYDRIKKLILENKNYNSCNILYEKK